MNQHDRIVADWRAEQAAGSPRSRSEAFRRWWGRQHHRPVLGQKSGPDNYPLIKGGQGRSARSVYSEAMMAAYAVCAIAAIILAGWLLAAAIGGPQ